MPPPEHLVQAAWIDQAAVHEQLAGARRWNGRHRLRHGYSDVTSSLEMRLAPKNPVPGQIFTLCYARALTRPIFDRRPSLARLAAHPFGARVPVAFVGAFDGAPARADEPRRAVRIARRRCRAAVGSSAVCPDRLPHRSRLVLGVLLQPRWRDARSAIPPAATSSSWAAPASSSSAWSCSSAARRASAR